MGYTKIAIRGISWVSALRIFTRLLSFLKIAIIARVLNPSQFGIFGIASLTLALAELLTETGVNVFLVQSKKDIKEYINSAWVVSILRGFFVFFIIVTFSHVVASFFKISSAISILFLISLVPLIRGFINPSLVSLQKNLMFGYEFWFKGFIFVLESIVSIILVFVINSAFALVWGIIAGAIMEVILSFILIKPIPKLEFRFNYIKEIINKGKWVTAYGVLNFLSQEGDNVIVGRLLGTTSLGIYQMGYKISTLPISEISDVVNRVVFPVYVKIEDDRRRLIEAFKKTTIIISILSMISGTLIFLFSREIVVILLGEKWLLAVPILRILSLYGIIRAIYGPSSALFLAVGKQKYITIMNSAKFFVLAVTIIPLVMSYGIEGAAYSALMSALIEVPIVLYFIVMVFRNNRGN